MRGGQGARAPRSLLVGHVTKEGALAGPRVLEHLVDCVLQFEGERERTYRTLRALKNRFGSTNEVGRLRDARGRPGRGPRRLARGSSARPPRAPGQRRAAPRWRARGRCSSRSRRSSRRRELVPPRRVVQRASTATGWRSCSPSSAATPASALGARDVFVNVVGGVRVDEPGADLAVALAVASAAARRRAARRRPAPLACFGEVGLTGELRTVGHPDRRAGRRRPKFGLRDGRRAGRSGAARVRCRAARGPGAALAAERAHAMSASPRRR